jgi:nucleoside phosphorylase
MDREAVHHNERTQPSVSHQPEQQKKFHHGLLRSRYDQYTVGWICALPIEMAAARAMLDDIHELLPEHTDERNTYTLGTIKLHNVVVACVPAGQYGTNTAQIVATNMLRTFESVRIFLMVGIGGGVPSRADLRLGDVVVGTRVIQCDFEEAIGDGQLLPTAVPRIPH